MAIKLGILGLGAFGQHFVPLFKAHPLVSEITLCDQDRAKLDAIGGKHGIARRLTSFDELLASDVDAVAVITQHWMHAPQCVRVLEAGKDVYSAVPAAVDMEEMTALVRAVERTGKMYMMGETSAYYAEAIYCRERYRRGDFGHLAYAQAEYMHDWDHGLYEVAERRSGPNWRAMARDWYPMSYPTHSVGMVLSVTGAYAKTVSAVGFRDTRAADAEMFSGPNPFSNETALFAMSDGSSMRINEMRRVGHVGAERMALYGTEGCFERTSDARLWVTKKSVERLDPTFANDHEDERRRRARLPKSLRNDGGHGGSHAFLVDDFVKASAWRLQPPVNVWQAARYLLPGLIAHQSALQGGKLLEIPDFGAGPAVDFAAFQRPTDGVAAAAR
jgi:predicted dehydrogenase